eukprot:gene2137-2635_t
MDPKKILKFVPALTASKKQSSQTTTPTNSALPPFPTSPHSPPNSSTSTTCGATTTTSTNTTPPTTNTSAINNNNNNNTMTVPGGGTPMTIKLPLTNKQIHQQLLAQQQPTTGAPNSPSPSPSSSTGGPNSPIVVVHTIIPGTPNNTSSPNINRNTPSSTTTTTTSTTSPIPMEIGESASSGKQSVSGSESMSENEDMEQQSSSSQQQSAETNISPLRARRRTIQLQQQQLRQQQQQQQQTDSQSPPPAFDLVQETSDNEKESGDKDGDDDADGGDDEEMEEEEDEDDRKTSTQSSPQLRRTPGRPKRQRREEEEEGEDEMDTSGNGTNSTAPSTPNSGSANTTPKVSSADKISTAGRPGRPKRSTLKEKKELQLQQYYMATQQHHLLNSEMMQQVQQGQQQNQQQPEQEGSVDESIVNEEEESQDEVTQAKKKGKYKQKKTVPNQLDIRPCWFTGCIKADRSLKILRPCLIQTCKTHAIKSETRIHEALMKGQFMVEENGKKDLVCGVCGEPNKTLSHCSNNDCAFGFCQTCIDIVTMKHGNHPNSSNKWSCWVCNAMKTRGRDRERTRWVRDQVEPANNFPARKHHKQVGKSNDFSTTEAGSPQQPSGDPNSTQSQYLINKRIRKNRQILPPFEPVKKYTSKKRPMIEDSPSSRPTSPRENSPNNNNAVVAANNQTNPDYRSILSPEREPISPVDFFIDESFRAIKFFSTVIQNPPPEITEHINTFVDVIGRIKTIRWSSDYSLVWRMVEDLASLIKRNLNSSQSIIEMQKEVKSLEDGALECANNMSRNVPLERAITMVFEHHETAGQIGKECCSTRNALFCSIEMASRSIEEHQRDLEVSAARDNLREVKINREISQLEEQIKVNAGEINRLKLQEDELLESLSKIRSALLAHESVRDSLTKKCNDLKIDTLLTKNNLTEKEKDIKTKQATLENEIYALKLIIKLIEGIYWVHDYFYATKVGDCEKLIGSRLNHLQNKLQLSIPQVPLATQALSHFKTIMIYHIDCMQHNVPAFHLEKPDRIKVTVNCINDFAQRYSDRVDIFNNPPEVDMRYVMAVHDAHYIRKLETSLPPENSEYETHLESDNTGAMVPVASKMTDDDDDQDIYDTFLSHRSMKAALRASGSVCAAVDAVSRSGYTRAFCAIRPPGHHAGRYGRTSDAPSQGYCLINNVAIGAKYASLTAGYSRIAVVDFDVHHGNGTQEILSGDENFLFISIHVCDEKRYFYPGTGKDVGDLDEVTGQYDGNILNIGLKRNSGSSIFIQQWVKKIIPRLEAYKPQLIFISAGFDGHKDDPTNGLKLNEEDYFTITKMIKNVAFKYSRGRVISVLEGGYGIENKTNSLMRCVNSHLKALIEDTDEELATANSNFASFYEDPATFDPTTAVQQQPKPRLLTNSPTISSSPQQNTPQQQSIFKTTEAPTSSPTTTTTTTTTTTSTLPPKPTTTSNKAIIIDMDTDEIPVNNNTIKDLSQQQQQPQKQSTPQQLISPSTPPKMSTPPIILPSGFNPSSPISATDLSGGGSNNHSKPEITNNNSTTTMPYVHTRTPPTVLESPSASPTISSTSPTSQITNLATPTNNTSPTSAGTVLGGPSPNTAKPGPAGKKGSIQSILHF